jgi:TctA family transporter
MKNLIQQLKESKKDQGLFIVVCGMCSGLMLLLFAIPNVDKVYPLLIGIAGVTSLIGAILKESDIVKLRQSIKEYDEYQQDYADKHHKDYNEYHRN